jgi:hypothetical protein
MTPPPTIGVVVLPARGGGRLDAALAALEWADVRAVLTLGVHAPLERAAQQPGIVRIHAVDEIGSLAVDWILLLAEEERVTADAVRTMRDAIAGAPDDRVFALPLITAALDMEVRPRRLITRLARRATPLRVANGLSVEFATTGRRIEPLAVPIVRSRGATLNDAVELLGAEADVVAALAEPTVAPRWGILWQPVVAASRALTAGVSGPRLGLGRWLIAVLEGYRVVVVYAKLWERRRARVTVDG